MSRPLLRALSLPLLATTVGCGHGHWIPVSEGQLDTQGVIIAAEDRSFVIQQGRPFETPFWLRGGDPICDHPTVEGYNRALDHGAVRVRIQYPGLAEPLYGVM